MTKTDFFRVLIKVFGLYSLIIALFTILPSNIFLIQDGFDLYTIIYLLVLVTIVVFLFILLIHKPNTIINWLKLDKGFDEERIYFEKLNSHNIIKLGAIIIGGLLLIDNIPSFLSLTYYAFKIDILGEGLKASEGIQLGRSFLNIIIGYLLVVNFERVSKLLKENKED